MVPQEDIKSISYIKSRTAESLAQVNRTHRPIFVTQNGAPKAVLVDTESYTKLQRAVELLKLINQSEREVETKKIISQKKVFEEIEKKFNV